MALNDYIGTFSVVPSIYQYWFEINKTKKSKKGKWQVGQMLLRTGVPAPTWPLSWDCLQLWLPNLIIPIAVKSQCSAGKKVFLLKKILTIHNYLVDLSTAIKFFSGLAFKNILKKILWKFLNKGALSTKRQTQIAQWPVL